MIMLSNVWDKIVDFYNKYPLSKGAISTLIICAVIALFGIIVGHAFKKADPLAKKQSKLLFVGHWFSEKVDNFIKEKMGEDFRYLTPYFMFVFLYLPASFLLGLLGMEAPASAWVSNLCLALGTFFFIHLTAIKSRKLFYYRRYFSMDNDSAFNIALNCLFTPINIATVVVPIISLSFRLLGNALAGTIIMTLIYAATASLSAKIESMGILGLSIALISILLIVFIRQFIKNKKIRFTPFIWIMIVVFAITVVYSAFGLNFNFVGVFSAPFLHLYFDLFGTYIQTMVFLFLSSIFISNEKVEE